MPQVPSVVDSVTEQERNSDDQETVTVRAEFNDNFTEDTYVLRSEVQPTPLADDDIIEERKMGPTRRSGFIGLVTELDSGLEDGLTLQHVKSAYEATNGRRSGDQARSHWKVSDHPREELIDWFWVLEKVPGGSDNRYFIREQVVYGRAAEYHKARITAVRRAKQNRLDRAKNGVYTDGVRSSVGDGENDRNVDITIEDAIGDGDTGGAEATTTSSFQARVDESLSSEESSEFITASVGPLTFREEFGDPNVTVERRRETAEHEVIAGSQSEEDFVVQSIAQKPPEISLTGVVTYDQLDEVEQLSQTQLVNVTTNRWKGECILTRMTTSETNNVWNNQKLVDIDIQMKAVREQSR